jgi:hypothetical protein
VTIWANLVNINPVYACIEAGYSGKTRSKSGDASPETPRYQQVIGPTRNRGNRESIVGRQPKGRL